MVTETINTRQRIKVFTWGGYWRDPRNKNPHQQASFHMAANSVAQIKRIVDRKQLWNVGETGNKRVIDACQAEPLELFVDPLDHITAPPYKVKIGDDGVRP